MKYLLVRLLPKNLVSRALGALSDIKLPSPILQSFIRIYCQFYAVKLAEAKKTIGEFKTFNDFFTRELKPDARPIDDQPDSIVSPVDGTIAEFGEIKNNLLVQTKGIYYSCIDLVGEDHAKLFNDGYFITLYLSPADYHRIHTPVAGKLKEFSYFSGNLWPVNDIGVQNVGGLFSLNERIVSLLEAGKSKVAIVKVGATVVGRIKLQYSDLSSNKGQASQYRLPVVPPKKYQKGDEIGRFQLGSTVILLFQKGSIQPENLTQNRKIKMGEILGKALSV